MPKLIAMAVRWIRGQKEAKEPELPRHLKESVSEAKSESDLVVSHSPFFWAPQKRGRERGAVRWWWQNCEKGGVKERQPSFINSQVPKFTTSNNIGINLSKLKKNYSLIQLETNPL